MQKGFTLPFVILIGLMVIVFAAMVVERFVFNDQHLNGPKVNSSKEGLEKLTENISSRESKEGNCQSNPNPQFTADFTDLSTIAALAPIGGVTGGSPGRSYMGVKEGMEAPIYSPTDAVLENIIYARRGGPDTPGEYGLLFRVSCEVTILFDHIDKVSDKIKEFSPKEPANTSRTAGGNSLNVLIKQGELLGYSDGTPQARTFDFLVINKAKPTTHINPKRWQWEQAVFAQCPYDYFSKELKDKYYAKIGAVTEMSGVKSFTPAQSCGDLSHDKPGTASGGWFKRDSTDIKGEYLAISRDSKRVDVAERKDGLFGPDSQLRDYSPKVYPEDISVGEEICYNDQQENKWVYIKLVSDTELAVAKGNGSCPASFPQEASETWER